MRVGIYLDREHIRKTKNRKLDHIHPYRRDFIIKIWWFEWNLCLLSPFYITYDIIIGVNMVQFSVLGFPNMFPVQIYTNPLIFICLRDFIIKIWWFELNLDLVSPFYITYDIIIRVNMVQFSVVGLPNMFPVQIYTNHLIFICLWDFIMKI